MAWGEGKVVAACVLLPILLVIVLPAIRSTTSPDEEDSFFYEGDPAQYADFDTSHLTSVQMRYFSSLPHSEI